MRHLLWAVIVLMGLQTPAWGQQTSAEVKLRRWHLGVQGVSSWRNTHDVFGRQESLSYLVEDKGSGLGLIFGCRLGDRFLLGVQALVAKHDLPNQPDRINDVEALVTGTVLFHQKSFLQPFLRGGFGLGGEYLIYGAETHHVFSFGPAAIAGGGFQLRLSSHLSLDFEGTATFVNYMTTTYRSDFWPDDSWKVRETNWGWRLGAGVVWWF